MLPFHPTLATAGELPSGPGWTYEVKWDGIRALVWVTPDGVHVATRHGKPLTEQFPELAAAAGSVPRHVAGRRARRTRRGRPPGVSPRSGVEWR